MASPIPTPLGTPGAPVPPLEAATTARGLAHALVHHCVHTIGLAGASVLLLEPRRCHVDLVAPGPGHADLDARLPAARALAEEVLRRSSSRFIERPGARADLVVAAASRGRGDEAAAEGRATWVPEGIGPLPVTLYAVPLRHGDGEVGSLTVLCADPEGEGDLALVHTATQIAAGVLVRLRPGPPTGPDVDGLAAALEVRVLVAQATGVLGERFDVGPTMAAQMLQSAATRSGRPLGVVAREIVTRPRRGMMRPQGDRFWRTH